MTPLIVVEPFAGAGGMALGLRAAGFCCIHASDMDQDSVESLKQAVGDTCAPEVLFLTPENAKVLAQKLPQGVDLLAAGVPCQNWSTAGKGLGEADPRNGFPAFLALVAACRPQAVLIENVKGLVSSKHKDYFDWIVGTLEELGYAVTWRVLVASDFGVPQRRERVIVVAFRDLEAFERFLWPSPTHSEALLVFAKWISGSYWEEFGLTLPSSGPSVLGKDQHVCENAPARPTRRELTVLKRIQAGQLDAELKLQRWRTVRDALGSETVLGAGTNPHGPAREDERERREITDEAVQVGNRGPWVQACAADGRPWTSRHPPAVLDETAPAVRARTPRVGTSGMIDDTADLFRVALGDLKRLENQGSRPHQIDEAAMSVRSLGGKGSELLAYEWKNPSPAVENLRMPSGALRHAAAAADFAGNSIVADMGSGVVNLLDHASFMDGGDGKCRGVAALPRLRKLLIREVRLLQGFPPDYQFAGSKTSQFRQCGNALPPPVAEAVGRSISDASQED